jgi:hypothetical protein
MAGYVRNAAPAKRNLSLCRFKDSLFSRGMLTMDSRLRGNDDLSLAADYSMTSFLLENRCGGLRR